MLAASDFEFKYRFWIFGALFWISFSTYSWDHANSAVCIVQWIARSRHTSPAAWEYRTAFAIAALLCVANAALRTWGTAYLNPEVMTDKRVHTSRLVADGPYRHVRNPLYFGNILLAIGFGLMSSPVGFVILVAGMIAFEYRLILREEAALSATQGDSYRAYCAAVPRLLPALRPKLPSAGTTPRWSDGFLGEAFMWTLAAAVAAFAVTLHLKIFWIVVGSAFVVYAACYAVIRTRQKKTAADAQPSNAERPPKSPGNRNSSL